MATIGFIGLGIMGRPMAKNLMKAGHSLIAFDAFATAALDDVVAAGAKRAASSNDVAARTAGRRYTAFTPADHWLHPVTIRHGFPAFCMQ